MNWKRWKVGGRGPVTDGGGLNGPNPFRTPEVAKARWWSPGRWFARRETAHVVRSPQQLEMILGAVKPVRNTLVDDDLEVVRRKGASRLIYESKPVGAQGARMEAESDRAWERLRGRKLDQLKVHAD